MKAAVKNGTRTRARSAAVETGSRFGWARNVKALWIGGGAAALVALVVGGAYVAGAFGPREVDYEARLRVSPAFRAYQVGIAAASQGSYKEAEDALQRALREDPNNALIYNALATVYTSQLDFPSALVTAEKGVYMAEGSPDLYYTVGLTRYHLGKYQDAEAPLRRALELRPDFPRASLWLGNTYMMLARTGTDGGFRPEVLDMAIEQFERALEGGADEPEFHAAYGEALYQKRELEKARQEYQRAVDLDAKNASNLVALGRVCEQLGDLDAARGALESAVAADRVNEEARYQLGLVLAKQGHVEEAVASLRMAVEIDRYHAGAHQQLAELLARSGQSDEAERERALAEESLRQAQVFSQMRMLATAEPSNADVANKLGIEYAKRGEYDEATAQFHRALALNPKHVDAMYQLAGVHLINGKVADALEGFTAVDKLSPGYRRTNEHLANLYRKLGQRQKADLREQMLEKQKAAGTLSDS